MDYRGKLLVEPGASVKLADFDPGFKSKHGSKDEAMKEMQISLAELDELQYKMASERIHSLLIVLQGLDGAGKDGTIRHLMTGMNPQDCRVTSFKAPTQEELEHDFLWRVHAHAPRRGEVAIFNRSHYEDVLVVRVHELVPQKVWSRRYDSINAFEEDLRLQNGTTVLKFFLHVSKEEQLARFAQRLEDPLRQWKISESDYNERKRWDDYTAAYEDVLSKTSTAHAPWFVIPSNHKWFRNLAIAHILVQTMRSLSFQLPQPTVDLGKIRKQFHQAEREEQETARR
jgi:PPK2 family polyphosphate:nucleotide phosphotransferase